MPVDPSITNTILDTATTLAVWAMGLAALGTATALYLLPSLIAVCRRHHHAAAIVALNLLLGWLFVGWVISLALSLTESHRQSGQGPAHV